jgi:hypothetical protein
MSDKAVGDADRFEHGETCGSRYQHRDRWLEVIVRLSFIEGVCLVAIGVAMVELQDGHRFERTGIHSGSALATATKPAAASGAERPQAVGISPRCPCGEDRPSEPVHAGTPLVRRQPVDGPVHEVALPAVTEPAVSTAD